MARYVERDVSPVEDPTGVGWGWAVPLTGDRKVSFSTHRSRIYLDVTCRKTAVFFRECAARLYSEDYVPRTAGPSPNTTVTP